jgi:hypothetical protein
VALKTIGTAANNSLKAFVVGTNDVIAADVATLLTDLRADGAQAPTGATTGQNTTPLMRINEPYVRQGKLFIPNRGVLQLRAGDYIGWDATTGWPIVVSGAAAASVIYVHS